MKILVVDDKAENRYLLEVLLTTEGHEVVTATNGMEALEKLGQQPVDLILSDILMPEMDGYRLCRECKQDEALRDIPFIFITAAFTSEADEAFARDLNADGIIFRPVEPEVLLTTIDQVMAEPREVRAKTGSPVREDTRYQAEYGERLISQLGEKIAQLEQAKEAAARLVAVVEQAGDSVVITDLEGKIVYVNPFFEQVTGYRSAEVIGQSSRILRSGHQNELFYRDLWGTITAGKQWDGHFVNRRKDGSLYHEEATLFPIKDTEGHIINYAAVKKDVTQRMEAEAKIRKLSQLYASLSYTNQTIVRAKDRDELFYNICRDNVEHGPFVLAWIGLTDEASRRVSPFCRYGPEDGYLDQIWISIDDVAEGRGPTGTAIREGRVSYVNDYATDERVLPWRELALGRGFRGAAALPFRLEGKTIGAMTLYVTEPDFFDLDQVNLLEEMSADISFALDSFGREARRHRAEQEREAALSKLEKALEGSIQIASTAVEMRDPYTAGHQRRVSCLAKAIATEIGLADEQIKGIGFGSLIHDIGKISVPSELLSYPTTLSPMQMELIRVHSQAGYEIVKGIDFPWPVAQMILQHHERIDGSGYPGKLKGDDIILEARILTVADVVEAMSSHRPYRPGLGIDVALAEIEKGRGSRYDSQTVDACLHLFREEGFSLA